MKANLIVLIVMLLAAGPAGAAERVDIQHVPSAVKEALDSAAPGEGVKQVTVHTRENRIVYEIELDRENRPNPRLYIAEDGQMLRGLVTDPLAVETDPAPYSPLLYPEYGPPMAPVVPKLTLSELPDDVRRTIEEHAAGREIAALEREQRAGRRGYRVTFRERGTNPQIFVTEGGQVSIPEEKIAGVPRLLRGTTRFEETPVAVQRSLRREVKGGQITRITEQREGEGPVLYRVDIKDPDGTIRQVVVSADGELHPHRETDERAAVRD
jgi:uncharacterized membrane protein YkoI